MTPEAHFRVDASRISFLRSGDGGVNSVGITSGLSENMEFTAEFQSAQAGETISPSFIGFGGKFVLPITLPFEFRTAIWAEKVSTSNPNTAPIFSSSIERGGFIVHPSLIGKFNGNIFLGITDADNTKKFAAGCNASHIVNGSFKIGGEYLYNYYGRNDRQESMLILVRTIPNVCVQLSPGYLQSPVMSTWMFTAGISISTASIEFVTPDNSKDKNNNTPSFDDLEKQIRDEQKENKKDNQ